MNQIPDALATLDRLEQHHPGFSRLYQERGHCYVALQDAPRAIDAYLRGVNINPALPTSWAQLEILYRMTGNTENAGMAAGHVATLKNPACCWIATSTCAPARNWRSSLEPENQRYLTTYATACVGLGEHEKALGLYRGILAATPQAAGVAYCSR